MLRTIAGIILILIAVLWLPLWFQMTLLVVGVLVLRYRILLLIPAIVADALYTPRNTLSLTHFKMTIVVGSMLVIWYLIVTQTRLTQHYVSNKK